MSFCPGCGSQLPADASFCEDCGAKIVVATPQPVRSNPAPVFVSAMAVASRTESTIVQVAPDYEADKIGVMEAFGWNLQNRQEIHLEGDSSGKFEYRPFRPDVYVTRTKVSHYIKLHFSRNLGLPHLEQVRGLEAEFNRLPFPRIPRLLSFLWPAGFVVLGIMALNDKSAPGGAGLIFLAIGGLWLAWKIFTYRKNSGICSDSAVRQQQLLDEVKTLTQISGYQLAG